MDTRAQSLIRTNFILIVLSALSLGLLLVISGHFWVQETGETRPAPSEFQSFVYGNNRAVEVTSTCDRAYYVIIIFPIAVDYRLDPLSATYNSATRCERGRSYTEKLDLTGKGFVEGARYYIIHASQEGEGGWRDPT